MTGILLLTGCSSEKTDFTLKGKISGLSSDTVLLYFQVPEFRLDTLVCQKGTFEYSFTPDTLNVFSLVFNANESLPIFAEKGYTVEVTGRPDSLNIKGKGENRLMNEINTLLRNTPQDSTIYVVDSLIRSNSDSFTNLYLIDKYYAHDSLPDYEHLEELIEGQSGIIKDTPYMMLLQAKVEKFTTGSNTRINSIYGKGRNGKNIDWLNARNKYILLDFWASWHPESLAEQDSLVKVVKALKKENFVIYSLSLDVDKQAWLKASDRDTTQWKQVCDFMGWNSSVIRNQKIHTIPYNLLLDKNKRIIARNIRGQELIDKVKKLIEEDKEKEKAAKKRKKKK